MVSLVRVHAAAPVLLAPADQSTIFLTNPHFQWTETMSFDPSAVGSYRIEIATDAAFTAIVDEDELACSIAWYVPQRLLTRGQTYYWRVTPVDATGAPDTTSATGEFTIATEPTVYYIQQNSSFETVSNTIQTASQNTPSIVRFAEGIHRLDPGTATVLFNLEGVSDLVVEGAGEGATLVSSQIVRSIKVTDCDRIMFKNLSFDLDPVSYLAGEVQAITSTYVDIEVVPDHPIFEEDAVIAACTSLMLLEPSFPRIKLNADTTIGYTWQNIGSRQYRLTLDDSAQYTLFDIGDIIIVEDRYPDKGGPRAFNCRDLVYWNVKHYTCANEGFSAKYCDRLRMLAGTGFELKAGRYLACNGGGTNLKNTRTGPWMEGCRIEACGDDSSNFNLNTYGVEEEINSTTVDIWLLHPKDEYGANPERVFEAGDRIVFVDPLDGSKVERLVVSSTYNSSDNTFRLVLDGDVGTIRVGKPNKDNTVTRVFNQGRHRYVVARNNVFTNNQRNGHHISCNGGLVENERIVGAGKGGLFMDGPERLESTMAIDLVARNNIFVGNSRIDSSVATIRVKKMGAPLGNAFHRNILFDSNVFSDCYGDDFEIEYADNVVIVNSTNAILEPVVFYETWDSAPAGALSGTGTLSTSRTWTYDAQDWSNWGVIDAGAPLGSKAFGHESTGASILKPSIEADLHNSLDPETEAAITMKAKFAFADTTTFGYNVGHLSLMDDAGSDDYRIESVSRSDTKKPFMICVKNAFFEIGAIGDQDTNVVYSITAHFKRLSSAQTEVTYRITRNGAPWETGVETLDAAIPSGTTLDKVQLYSRKLSYSLWDDIEICLTDGNAFGFVTNSFSKAAAAQDSAYTAWISDDAGDPFDEAVTFSKVSGPDWLFVSAYGSLSGTPGVGDIGSNVFVVRVTNSSGDTDDVTLTIEVRDHEEYLLEYALGGSSTHPVFQIDENHLYYVHNERTDDAALTYTVQLSTNLVSNGWKTNGVEFVGESAFFNVWKTVTNKVPMVGNPQQFMRLKVEQPTPQ